MEGDGSSNASCLMAFGGDNSNALCPMIMMPSMTTHPNADNNSLYLPLPHGNAHQDLNRHATSGSSMMVEEHYNNNNNNNMSTTGCYFMENNNNNNNSDGSCSLKAKIIAHPHYHRLLAAYVNCQKIGAPPEVVARLEEACASAATMSRHGTSCIGEDPALDQFMEAYCEMLTKYEQELSKPFKEAMLFLSRIECQFKALALASSDSGDELLLLFSLERLNNIYYSQILNRLEFVYR